MIKAPVTGRFFFSGGIAYPCCTALYAPRPLLSRKTTRDACRGAALAAMKPALCVEASGKTSAVKRGGVKTRLHRRIQAVEIRRGVRHEIFLHTQA